MVKYLSGFGCIKIIYSLVSHLAEYRLLGGQFSLSNLQILFCVMVFIAIIEEFAVASLGEDFLSLLL